MPKKKLETEVANLLKEFYYEDILTCMSEEATEDGKRKIATILDSAATAVAETGDEDTEEEEDEEDDEDDEDEEAAG